MPLRLIEVIANSDKTERIEKTAAECECLDAWHGAKNKDGRRIVRILIRVDDQQKLTDELQKILDDEENWRIVVQQVEATIPRQQDNSSEDESPGRKIVRGTITREELYDEIEKGARYDFNFILLVILSTIVCSIGLIKSDIAVVIGAMVIAPLLGPNLALAFGVALGDRHLVIRSIKSNLLGLGLTLVIALLTGMAMNGLLSQPVTGTELIDRTRAGYENFPLALAAGAAAVLSMTTGLSSALVGVMVAVALMPPAVTLGLMLGMGSWDLAYGAGLLLSANIICIAIAAQVVFVLKGIKPRTWYMRKKSMQSVRLNLSLWIALLLMLAILIGLHSR